MIVQIEVVEPHDLALQGDLTLLGYMKDTFGILLKSSSHRNQPPDGIHRLNRTFDAMMHLNGSFSCRPVTREQRLGNFGESLKN